MIIARAPLRISFVGGGSDLPSYCENSDGAVVSMAINKYVYVAVNPKFDGKLRLSYYTTEHVDSSSELQHGLARACLDYTGLNGGLEIVTIADIPSRGTGLGSSSTFTVALLHALHAFKGEYAGEAQLAEEACRMEIDLCKAPIGRQDQYIAAYGGLNYMRFKRGGKVEVERIICSTRAIEQLQRNLLLFYTGRTRDASAILQEQSAHTRDRDDTRRNLDRMVALAAALRDSLHKETLEDFGPLLHENWLLKRELAAQVSDDAIDDWYRRARAAGAEGGKILGAGGGGFLLLYAPEDSHPGITEALAELRPIPFALERNGSSVIFYHP
jgi:D-glycero-alpha-D-manno-heptose-7-phosphate kinase